MAAVLNWAGIIQYCVRKLYPQKEIPSEGNLKVILLPDYGARACVLWERISTYVHVYPQKEILWTVMSTQGGNVCDLGGCA